MKTTKYSFNGLSPWVLICFLVFPFGITDIPSNAGSFHRPEASAKSLKNRSRSVEQVRQIYTRQIGIREKQSNAGPEIEEYLRYVNLPSGQPWCAAFVCWVYGQAGVRNPQSGWSPSLFPDSKVIWPGDNRNKYQVAGIKYQVSGSKYEQHGIWIPARISSRFCHTYNVQRRTFDFSPAAGDIFALYFPEKKRIAHTGFVDQWDGTWLITVEGNTNVSGSREGDGVYKKRRLVRSVYQVARYIHQP